MRGVPIAPEQKGETEKRDEEDGSGRPVAARLEEAPHRLLRRRIPCAACTRRRPARSRQCPEADDAGHDVNDEEEIIEGTAHGGGVLQVDFPTTMHAAHRRRR